jgi:uncharacterized protein
MAIALADEDLLRIVDFYKCYRAYVRGKVESIQSLGAPQASARKRGRKNAKKYFKLALQYAVGASRPLVLVTMGRIASGKSTLARSLADELEWQIFSSDEFRKRLARVPLYQRLAEGTRKQHLYGAEMTKKTYEELLGNAMRHVRNRHSVVLDATYNRRLHRDQLRDRLRKVGVAFYFVEAKAPDKVIRRRLKERAKQTAQVSDARIEDFQALNRLYEPPKELPACEFVAVNTSKAPPEATATQVLKALAERCARAD